MRILEVFTAVCMVLCFTSLTGAQVVNPANGHNYLLTTQAGTIWQARAEAAAHGGYLTAINDSWENGFVGTYFSPGLEQPWIGLSDELQEGVFIWDSGEPLDYTNWAPGQPDDYLANQDHVQWVHSIDQWADLDGSYVLDGIIEIPHPNQPKVNPANGNTYLLTSRPGTISEARQEAAALGGHLVKINDAVENSWIVSQFSLADIYWIGLSDEVTEGTFLWDNGDALSYSNWRVSSGEPNGGTGENHVLIWPSQGGVWSTWVGGADQNPGFPYGIIEIPSVSPQVHFNPSNGSSYLLTSSVMDFASARLEAASYGGYLATIKDAAENQFLATTFGTPAGACTPTSGTCLWIGLSDEMSEGTFVWDSGEPLSYTNWRTGEPNNNGGVEDAVEMEFIGAEIGGWNDGEASALRFGIIEIPGTCPIAPNTSLGFDGIDDWVRIPDHPDLDGFGDFTIEFWILSTTSQYRVALSKGEDGNGHIGDCFSFALNHPSEPLGTIYCGVYSGNTSSASVASTRIVTDGAWHHVALARSGSAVSLFIDGIADGSATFSAPLNDVWNPLTICTLADSTGSPAPGHACEAQIDEVRIWNVGRSHADIISASLWSLSGNEPGLVALYDMQAGAGQVVIDKTGHGHDGTLGGTNAIAADDPAWSPAGPRLACVPAIVGVGQPNSAKARLEVNEIDTASSPGPFAAPVQRGSIFTLDFQGDPNSFYELYGSQVLTPSGWDFSGFGLFDLGTGPTFPDVQLLFSGFQGGFPFYSLDGSGTSQISLYVHPSLTPGPVIAVQALIQVAPPWAPDPIIGIPVWSTLTATQVIVVQ